MLDLLNCLAAYAAGMLPRMTMYSWHALLVVVRLPRKVLQMKLALRCACRLKFCAEY
jgi:hypothetical protein